MVSCLKQGSKKKCFAHPWSSVPYMYNVSVPQKIGKEEDGGKNHQVINECLIEGFEAESNIVTC